MGALEDVLARLVNEAGFRDELAADPATALTGYDLSREDLEVLAASLDEGDGGEHGVEQRTSKSALLGILGALTEPAHPDTHDGQYLVTGATHPADSDPHQDQIDLQSYHHGSATQQAESDLQFVRGPASDAGPDALTTDPAQDEPADHIETYEVTWGTRVGTEGQVHDAGGSVGDPDRPLVLGSAPNPPPGDDQPVEQVSLAYGEVDADYEPQGEPATDTPDEATYGPPQDAEGGAGATSDDPLVAGTDDDDAQSGQRRNRGAPVEATWKVEPGESAPGDDPDLAADTSDDAVGDIGGGDLEGATQSDAGSVGTPDITLKRGTTDDLDETPDVEAGS